ncbi:hypothetical protein [Rhodococcoides fascians]|uniref:hypothetical protein n=1 Tax=Rhodococcoides fascians TaxID=1828 RepID=UPI00050CB582|nr:hypothetical protein [Rhodococcus fascians]
MTETTNTETVTCIADGPDCTGDVDYRDALSGTGVSHPRCDKHWQDRLDLADDLRRRYPAHAPADFDPTYAGEHWDEDY